MTKQLETSQFRQSVTEAFAGISRPDLSSIYPLGCCEEHEGDFEWYRSHSWQEFMEELPTERFDPFEFSSLHPSAYHYFVPSIILATWKSICANPKGLHVWECDWVNVLVPLKHRTVDFKRDYLPCFDSQQRIVIVNYLWIFNGWHFEVSGYPNADVERVIEQIWQP